MIHTIDDAIALLRRYHRYAHPSPGIRASSVPNDLPYGLWRVYGELGALIGMELIEKHEKRYLFGTQDRLVPVSRIKRIGGWIEFAYENQGNWAARCAAWTHDPPVLTNAGEMGEGSDEFELVCDSLNEFLITLCLRETIMSSPVVFFIRDVKVADVFSVPLDALWLHGPYAVRGWRMDFFHIPGEDMLVSSSHGTLDWVGAHAQSILRYVKPEYQDSVYFIFQ